jgi:hypothetical protein
MARITGKHYARRPFDYDGESLDRGQIFQFKGLRNDERLLTLGYAQKLQKNADELECNRCGAVFTGHGELNAHGKLRHPAEPMTEDELADALEREHKKADQTAPLNLEKTKASRSASA